MRASIWALLRAGSGLAGTRASAALFPGSRPVGTRASPARSLSGSADVADIKPVGPRASAAQFPAGPPTGTGASSAHFAAGTDNTRAGVLSTVETGVCQYNRKHS